MKKYMSKKVRWVAIAAGLVLLMVTFSGAQDTFISKKMTTQNVESKGDDWNYWDRFWLWIRLFGYSRPT